MLMTSIAVVVSFIVFVPLFYCLDMLSNKVYIDAYQDIQKSNQYITYLSASAILLTFTIIQVIGSSCLSNVLFLKLSWYAFAASILFGVICTILMCSNKVFSLAERPYLKYLFEEQEKGAMSKDAFAQKFSTTISRKARIHKSIFVVLLIQFAAFVTAILYLIVFASQNV
jgi:hypothetical protein